MRLHVLLFICVVLLIIYLYNRFTLRENFYSRTKDLMGKARKIKRNAKKKGEHFIGKIAYKLKSGLRKVNF